MLCWCPDTRPELLPCRWWYWRDVEQCMWGHQRWSDLLYSQTVDQRLAYGFPDVSTWTCWSAFPWPLRALKAAILADSCLENVCHPSWSMESHSPPSTVPAYILCWSTAGKVWQGEKRVQLQHFWVQERGYRLVQRLCWHQASEAAFPLALAKRWLSCIWRWSFEGDEVSPYCFQPQEWWICRWKKKQSTLLSPQLWWRSDPQTSRLGFRICHLYPSVDWQSTTKIWIHYVIHWSFCLWSWLCELCRPF